MIYFVKTEDNKFVKIGYTSNLKNRLVAIQNGNPLNIVLIKAIKGGLIKEQLIHKYLNKYHHNREWFVYTNYVEDYINSLIDNDIEPSYANYDPQIDDNIEHYYSNRYSNIQIANLLSISIHKVRGVIKKRKLKYKYSNTPKPKYYQHGGVDNYLKT